MAETLTIDPTPQAEVVGEVEGVQLTQEEQDSLKVGEEVQAQQEQLLAGKYKDAESLEKAYIELQKKLGSQEETTEKETTEATTEETETDQPKLSDTAQLITSASDE